MCLVGRYCVTSCRNWYGETATFTFIREVVVVFMIQLRHLQLSPYRQFVTRQQRWIRAVISEGDRPPDQTVSSPDPRGFRATLFQLDLFFFIYFAFSSWWMSVDLAVKWPLPCSPAAPSLLLSTNSCRRVQTQFISRSMKKKSINRSRNWRPASGWAQIWWWSHH